MRQSHKRLCWDVLGIPDPSLVQELHAVSRQPIKLCPAACTPSPLEDSLLSYETYFPAFCFCLVQPTRTVKAISNTAADWCWSSKPCRLRQSQWSFLHTKCGLAIPMELTGCSLCQCKHMCLCFILCHSFSFSSQQQGAWRSVNVHPHMCNFLTLYWSMNQNNLLLLKKQG